MSYTVTLTAAERDQLVIMVNAHAKLMRRYQQCLAPVDRPSLDDAIDSLDDIELKLQDARVNSPVLDEMLGVVEP